MAIYCNTLEGNMQYGDDPYCFTPTAECQPQVISTPTVPYSTPLLWYAHFIFYSEH